MLSICILSGGVFSQNAASLLWRAGVHFSSTPIRALGRWVMPLWYQVQVAIFFKWSPYFYPVALWHCVIQNLYLKFLGLVPSNSNLMPDFHCSLGLSTFSSQQPFNLRGGGGGDGGTRLTFRFSQFTILPSQFFLPKLLSVFLIFSLIDITHFWSQA